MCAAKVQFGILSSYEETVFLYRRDDTLFISAVCTRQSSLLLQVFMFLYIAQLPEKRRNAFFKVPWGEDHWWKKSKKILEQPAKPGIHPAYAVVSSVSHTMRTYAQSTYSAGHFRANMYGSSLGRNSIQSKDLPLINL